MEIILFTVFVVVILGLVGHSLAYDRKIDREGEILASRYKAYKAAKTTKKYGNEKETHKGCERCKT